MFLLALLACGQSPGLSQAPPPAIALSDTPLVREETATLSVQLPGQASGVWLLASSAGPGVGPCSAGVCADIVDPVFLGPESTNPNGVVRFDVDVPDVPTMWFQVATRRGGQLLASEVFERTTLVEICTNGFDDDRDGLVDCEDGRCMGSGSCAELICDDFNDDDGDGLVDCRDDDCWGQGCSGVISRMLAGRYELAGQLDLGFHVSLGRSSRNIRHELQLTGIQGVARQVTSMGGTSACTWTASQIDITGATYQSSYFGSSYPIYGGISAQGVQMGPGCAIPSSMVLPLDATWSAFSGVPSLPRVGEAPYAIWSSHYNRMVGNWLQRDATYNDRNVATFVSSPRTYSYGSGSTYMFYNFQGTNTDAVQRGDVLPGGALWRTGSP
jgi:hypothetical protein